MHRKILYLRYSTELSHLYNFYRLSERGCTDERVLGEFVREETGEMNHLLSQFLKDPVGGQRVAHDTVPGEVAKRVTDDINKGLPLLRRQLLETSYSVFERFLCHVVRVYLHTFSEVLKQSNQSVTFRDIADLPDNESIFDVIVEKEIDKFRWLSLKDKKKYMGNRLHIYDWENIWIHEGEALWEDIDNKRKAIVHDESVPDISFNYLLTAINYFQRIFLLVAIYGQVFQGIPFEPEAMSSITKIKTPPTLKPSLEG